MTHYLPFVMWSTHFFVTHIQTEKISSWNGPTVHVCCSMLARTSAKTFVSRVRKTAKKKIYVYIYIYIYNLCSYNFNIKLNVCTLHKFAFLNRSEPNFAHIFPLVWKRPRVHMDPQYSTFPTFSTSSVASVCPMLRRRWLQAPGASARALYP